jgi:hypothetical protein
LTRLLTFLETRSWKTSVLVLSLLAALSPKLRLTRSMEMLALESILETVVDLFCIKITFMAITTRSVLALRNKH